MVNFPSRPNLRPVDPHPLASPSGTALLCPIPAPAPRVSMGVRCWLLDVFGNQPSIEAKTPAIVHNQASSRQTVKIPFRVFGVFRGQPPLPPQNPRTGSRDPIFPQSSLIKPNQGKRENFHERPIWQLAPGIPRNFPFATSRPCAFALKSSQIKVNQGSCERPPSLSRFSLPLGFCLKTPLKTRKSS